jgi:hypothetical protein
MTGRHRRPRRATGRNLAATAAVLTAGALPLAVAGSASADTGTLTSSPLAGLPISGVPQTVGVTAQHLRNVPPLAREAAGDLTADVKSGTLLAGTVAPQKQTRTAPAAPQPAEASAALAGQATRLSGDAADVLPVSEAFEQVAPAMSGHPERSGASVLQGTPVSEADHLGAGSMTLSGGVARQAQPVAQRLRAEGVPTVGDVTGAVGATRMPAFGTVGAATSVVPAEHMLGADSLALRTVGATAGL